MKETLIGTAIGITIAVGAFALYDQVSFGSKWMQAQDWMDPKEKDTVEGKAVIAMFNRDNGTKYCVPKMNAEQLGEFKAAMPGLLIKSAFESALSGKEFDEKKPMEFILTKTLSKNYPCKK